MKHNPDIKNIYIFIHSFNNREFLPETVTSDLVVRLEQQPTYNDVSNIIHNMAVNNDTNSVVVLQYNTDYGYRYLKSKMCAQMERYLTRKNSPIKGRVFRYNDLATSILIKNNPQATVHVYWLTMMDKGLVPTYMIKPRVETQKQEGDAKQNDGNII